MLSPRSPEQLGGSTPGIRLAFHGGGMPETEEEQAKGCPILEGGGSIEVGETFEVM